MFDQIGGLPVHALVVHATVVFVPLLVVGAIVYGVVPALRARIGWAVLLVSIIAPICALVAKESGEKLYDRTLTPNSSASFRNLLNTHMHYGTVTAYLSLALGVLTLIMTIVTLRRPDKRLPRIPDIAAAVVLVVLAVISGYYVYKTGDSGAHAVWAPTS